MQRIRIDRGYRPRADQAEVHRSLKRFNVLVCHRRFGKTVLAVNELINRAMLLTGRLDRPRLAYIAPFYGQAKEAAWDYLQKYTEAIPGRDVKKADPVRVELPGGARIRVAGADNPDSLRGAYFDWVVLDEYAQMRPSVWSEVIRPMLADRGGGALFIGTPKGRNEFYTRYEKARKGIVTDEDGQIVGDPEEWFAGIYRASETGIIPPEELASARKDMTEEEYAQEFECSFSAAIRGAYYGKEMAAAEAAGRITRVPWEPALPVHTCWDLGGGPNMAIWFFQLLNTEVRWIDFRQGFEGLPACVKLMREKPYVYGQHLLPHDCSVKEIGTGVSRQETLESLGLYPNVCPQQSVDDGINAVRLMLARSWFDAEKCGPGIEALRQYRADYDERLNTFRDRPRHDWASHPADGIRTGAMNLDACRGTVAPPDMPDLGAGAWMG